MCRINTSIHINDILIVLYQQKCRRLIRYSSFKIRDLMFANLHDFARFLHNCGENTLMIYIQNCLVSLEYCFYIHYLIGYLEYLSLKLSGLSYIPDLNYINEAESDYFYALNFDRISCMQYNFDINYFYIKKQFTLHPDFPCCHLEC